MTSNKEKRTNILMIDTAPLSLIGIKTILSKISNIDIHTTTTSDIFRLINTYPLIYDVYILDIRLEGETKNCLKGIKLIELLQKKQKNARIIVYTLCEGTWHIKQYQRLNINGIIHKTAAVSTIKQGIFSVINNEKYVCPHFRRLLKSNNNINQDSFLLETNLNIIEMEIIRLAAQGYTSKEIAHKLERSIHTIIDYRKQLFLKFNVNTMEELIVKAIRNGFPITI